MNDSVSTPTNGLKKAVIYTRVSDPGQVNGLSLDVQKERCEKWAIDNGYTVVGVYTDGGKTGTKTVGRQALEELLNKCADERIDVVLVIDTDRLARNEKDHYMLRDILRKAGSRLVAINQLSIDDSPEGMLLEGSLVNLNAFYSRIIGRKVKTSLEKKFWDGHWPGWAPLGYMNVNIGTEDKPERVVKVDPDRGCLITLMFNLFSTGNYTGKRLEDEMFEKGLRTKTGKRVYHSAIYAILNKHFYYGEMHFKGMVNPHGMHEPLTTRAIFNACQRVLDIHNQHACRRRRYRWLYNGLLFCETCGSRMYAEFQHKKRHAYYHCNTRNHCVEPFVELYDLKKKVEEEFRKIQLPKSFVNRVVKKANELVNQTSGSVEEEKKGIENAIMQLKSRKSKLLEAMLDDTIDKDIYKRKDIDLDIQIRALEEKIHDIETNAKIDIDAVSRVMEMASNIYQTYKQSNFDAKRLYLKLFFEKFTMKERNIVYVEPTPLFASLQEESGRVSTNWLRD
ncbi:recombinase family protein [Patescibacteria group bacterium]|nr:recombinase family protein [Patescibacteria group bacterium]